MQFGEQCFCGGWGARWGQEPVNSEKPLVYFIVKIPSWAFPLRGIFQKMEGIPPSPFLCWLWCTLNHHYKDTILSIGIAISVLLCVLPLYVSVRPNPIQYLYSFVFILDNILTSLCKWFQQQISYLKDWIIECICIPWWCSFSWLKSILWWSILIVITLTHDNNCQITMRTNYDFIKMSLLLGYYRKTAPILL